MRSTIVPLSFPGEGDTGGVAIGIYIHIPFCRAHCAYCDFNTWSGLEQLIPQYTQVLLCELRSWEPFALPAKSIYFGGGTPSLMPAENLRLVIDACRGIFKIADDAEVTLEANPGTLSQAAEKETQACSCLGSGGIPQLHFIPSPLTGEDPILVSSPVKGEGQDEGDKRLFQHSLSAGYLKNIRHAGINRLSLGVQSFDDILLKILGRLHSSSQAKDTFFESRKAGFENISLDLMYGLPAQSMKQWEDSLDEAIELHPEHLSLYSLALGKTTPLYREIKSGNLPAPDSDLAADMYILAENKLKKAGYVHYEISNWAKPGKESWHNLNYWHVGRCAGIGAGAHSFFNGERSWNALQPAEYICKIRETGRAAAGGEHISPEIERADFIILGLRLTVGLSLKEFRKKYGLNIEELYRDQVSFLKQAGLLEESNGNLRLTPRGRLLGNEVFQRFLSVLR